MAEYWAQSNGSAKTYGDIMDAFNTKPERVTWIETAAPKSSILSIGWKLALILTALVVLMDRINV